MTNNIALATKYRPQTFADIVGQDLIKGILSRASFEDKVAPAYLLSGTRGVGKTTIARVFAKALNCKKSPTLEPCNKCEACINIMQGSFVDVVELDGASNRGIDDARRLREIVSYAAIEGRYKVIIIDEAHMLTREAFNALLKTLEEPPKNVTFILATTEAHKFPITILSRCQHFIFKQIPQSLLEKHLIKLLEEENVKYSKEAVELIAKRASGSARDAISLLSQALALCSDELETQKVRQLLGLAGQEFIYSVLSSISQKDCGTLSVLIAELLDQGADLGFFLRELATNFRNLFLVKQAGKAIIDKLNISEQESLLQLVDKFSLSYIHAAWQMVLEGQKSVLSSLEPAVSLELLLYNLAILPELLPIQDLQLAELADDSQKKKPELVENNNSTVEPVTQVIAQKKNQDFVKTSLKQNKAKPSEEIEAEEVFNAQVECVNPNYTGDLSEQNKLEPSDKSQSNEVEEQNFSQEKNIANFLDFALAQGLDSMLSSFVRQSRAEFFEEKLVLATQSNTVYEELDKNKLSLKKLLEEWLKQACELEILAPVGNKKSEAELKLDMRNLALVKLLEEKFDANLLSCKYVDDPTIHVK